MLVLVAFRIRSQGIVLPSHFLGTVQVVFQFIHHGGKVVGFTTGTGEDHHGYVVVNLHAALHVAGEAVYIFFAVGGAYAFVIAFQFRVYMEACRLQAGSYGSAAAFHFVGRHA